MQSFLKTNTSLTVIVAAALLLELTTGVMYYSAQNIIEETVNSVIQREMNSIYLCIQNKLIKVEVTMANAAWVVQDNLDKPDTMYTITRSLVENNLSIMGSSISFIPYYYPEKGRWFEPFAGRRDSGNIESLQLGSAGHDYTKKEFFTAPIFSGSGHWCDPYLDAEGAKAIITSYSVPVRDNNGRAVGVVNADVSLNWLGVVMEEDKSYKSLQRFLVTGKMALLAGEDNPTLQLALEELKADDDHEGTTSLTNNEGRKMHVYYTPVGGNTDWVLISVLDDKDAFGHLWRIRMLLLLPVMIGLFFAGFIVYRSSRNLERLRMVNAEKQRIDGELQVANHIQQSMLPHSRLQHEDMQIYGSLVPAREVGGDLFDYFVRDEKLFFCIGDVSGKGAASAMLMGVIHSLFRSASAHENNPARVMQTINETSCQGNDSNMFVTLFIGVLDLPTGRLRYCDAGHDCPIILPPNSHLSPVNSQLSPVNSQLSPVNSQLSTLDCIPHLPVGVFDDTKYSMQEAVLEKDSTLFLYTDGLTEAKNRERKQFGLERVEELLSVCAQEKLNPQEILSKVTQQVHKFVGGAPQSDDLTMLAIHYTPRTFQCTMTETLKLQNDIRQVSQLGAFMKSVAEEVGIEASLAAQLRLAVEEAVVNVMSYAYPADQTGDITVRASSDGRSLKIEIIDQGVPFDPTTKELSDTTLSAEERQIGGLGILLVRDLMDSINYEREEGKNILTLWKKFSTEEK